MDKNKKPSVAIVVLTYKAEKLILSCLSSLNKINKNNFDVSIIVIDNGSDKTTLEKIAQNYPAVILIENKVNYGFAKGINYGLRFAYQQGFQWLLLLNDDTLLEKDFLIKLISSAKKNKYYICGPKIITLENKIWSLGGELDKKRFSGGLLGYGEANKQITRGGMVDYISGTAMLVQRAVFKKIGFLDEDYFLYYDDVDFCYRSQRVGFSSYIVPSSEITHLETVTIKKNSPSHYYHAAKSHLIFVFKRAPFEIRIREFFFLGIRVLRLLFEKNQTRRKYELLAIADFILGKFGQNTIIKPS